MQALDALGLYIHIPVSRLVLLLHHDQTKQEVCMRKFRSDRTLQASGKLASLRIFSESQTIA